MVKQNYCFVLVRAWFYFFIQKSDWFLCTKIIVFEKDWNTHWYHKFLDQIPLLTVIQGIYNLEEFMQLNFVQTY